MVRALSSREDRLSSTWINMQPAPDGNYIGHGLRFALLGGALTESVGGTYHTGYVVPSVTRRRSGNTSYRTLIRCVRWH